MLVQKRLQDAIQPTSKDALTSLNTKGVVGAQEVAYLDVLRLTPDGLTDAEAANLLRLPCSTVSARRNGINMKHVQAGADTYLIVNIDGERRPNPSGRTVLVWRLNPQRWN